MRQFTLTLASRLILRGAIAVVKQSDNWQTALRKFDILKATEPTKKEQKAIDAASAITITCEECGKQTSIPGTSTRLGQLPDSPKELLLEEAPFQWLEEFEKTHTPWPANQAFVDLHEAIKGAEKVKTGKEAK